MNLRVKIAAFPIPPDKYSDADLKQMTRKLNSWLENYYNPGDIVCTSIEFYDVKQNRITLPPNGYGLQLGGMYYDPINGITKIVMESDVFAPSFQTRVKLREVTVTT